MIFSTTDVISAIADAGFSIAPWTLRRLAAIHGVKKISGNFVFTEAEATRILQHAIELADDEDTEEDTEDDTDYDDDDADEDEDEDEDDDDDDADEDDDADDADEDDDADGADEDDDDADEDADDEDADDDEGDTDDDLKNRGFPKIPVDVVASTGKISLASGGLPAPRFDFSRHRPKPCALKNGVK